MIFQIWCRGTLSKASSRCQDCLYGSYVDFDLMNLTGNQNSYSIALSGSETKFEFKFDILGFAFRPNKWPFKIVKIQLSLLIPGTSNSRIFFCDYPSKFPKSKLLIPDFFLVLPYLFRQYLPKELHFFEKSINFGFFFHGLFLNYFQWSHFD